MLKMNVILPGVMIRAYNAENEILVDTFEQLKGKRWSEKEENEINKYIQSVAGGSKYNPIN